jgi:CBS domain-containing protein
MGGLLKLGGLPGGDGSLWPLVGMAAVMGGTMRSPLTGVLFAVELTADTGAILPLLIAATLAHCFTVLVMKRSILTEKVARRGFHVSREYSVDPLELLSVGEVMSTKLVTIPASLPLPEVLTRYFAGGGPERHQGYPVVDQAGSLVGMITRANLLEDWVSRFIGGGTAGDAKPPSSIIAYDLIEREPIIAFPWESCRAAAERMAEAGVGRLPVVDPVDKQRLIGILTRSDLLKPRARQAAEERKRERFLSPRFFPGVRRRV